MFDLYFPTKLVVQSYTKKSLFKYSFIGYFINFQSPVINISRFPNNINLVLDEFKDNFKSLKPSPEKRMVVSSAKTTNLSMFVTLQMSLIYVVNNLGPSTEPCGTPRVIFKNTDFD